MRGDEAYQRGAERDSVDNVRGILDGGILVNEQLGHCGRRRLTDLLHVDDRIDHVELELLEGGRGAEWLVAA